MSQKVAKFVEYIANLIGREPDTMFAIEAEPADAGMIYGIVYQNYPEAGLTTGFTYGLSEMQHPEWKSTKPELSITTLSQSVDWVKAMVYLVEWNRINHSFLPGSLFHYGSPISAESAMDSFLIFNLAIGTADEFRNIALDEDTISMYGVHPLHHGEVALLQKVGIRKFMELPEYQLFSVTRPDLSALYKLKE